MRPTLRDRLVMPILVPLAIVVVIAAALYGFSRILLSVTPSAATITAVVVATGILVAAALAAGRKQVRLSTIGGMVGITAGVAMLAGGIALAVVGGTEEGEEGERSVVALAAADIAFEPTSLTVPAGTPFTIRFHNQDAGVEHNVEIFDDPEFGGEPLFAGQIVTGVGQIDYAVGALDPGPYAFRCIVHPDMTGEMRAQAAPGGEPGGPGGPTVVAQDISFDTSTIELPPDAPTTVTFENRDPGTQHNIAIYSDSSLEQELFNGEIVTGPATAEYQVPALQPGEYYFLCVVHPDMNGQVAVGGEQGPAGETGGGNGTPEPTGAT